MDAAQTACAPYQLPYLAAGTGGLTGGLGCERALLAVRLVSPSQVMYAELNPDSELRKVNVSKSIKLGDFPAG